MIEVSVAIFVAGILAYAAFIAITARSIAGGIHRIADEMQRSREEASESEERMRAVMDASTRQTVGALASVTMRPRGSS